MNKWNNERYYFYKSRGICVMCGCNDAMLNTTTCYECGEKQRERYREYRNKDVDACRQRERESHKKLREKREADGKCTKCGSNKEKDKYKTCKRCRAKRKEVYLKTELKSSIYKRDLREYLGLCTICGNEERVEGKKVCKKCYETLIKNALNAREHIKYKEHIWRKYEDAGYKKYMFFKNNR